MAEIPVDEDALGLLTMDEVAARLKLSLSTVKRLVYAGTLESVTIGRSRRVAPEAVLVYKNQLRGLATEAVGPAPA